MIDFDAFEKVSESTFKDYYNDLKEYKEEEKSYYMSLINLAYTTYIETPSKMMKRIHKIDNMLIESAKSTVANAPAKLDSIRENFYD